MAQQGTEEQQTDSEQQAGDEASGKHRSSGDEQASSDGQSSSGDQGSEQSSGEKTQESSSDGEQNKQDSSSGEQKKQDSNSGDQKTEKQQAPTEQKTDKQQRGNADTSWAEPEQSPKRSLDVGELAWRTGNVIATVVRSLALIFALVLIVNVVLILVGVNPANGVAQFIGGVADTVVLGFRNLFVPANPTVGLIVNSLVAAVFWVFVGELLSRVIRFLAARVK